MLHVSGFYHKLVTRGDEALEPDEIKPLPEELQQEETLSPRADIKRRSSRRMRRRHSSRKSESFDTQLQICSHLLNCNLILRI